MWQALNWLFFFNDTATTEIYTLSLHDALPISTPPWRRCRPSRRRGAARRRARRRWSADRTRRRSEEHTSELQSQSNLVCRLLLEKKKKMRGRDEELRQPLWAHGQQTQQLLGVV